jgi:hypothetical protein
MFPPAEFAPQRRSVFPVTVTATAAPVFEFARIALTAACCLAGAAAAAFWFPQFAC